MYKSVWDIFFFNCTEFQDEQNKLHADFFLSTFQVFTYFISSNSNPSLKEQINSTQIQPKKFISNPCTKCILKLRNHSSVSFQTGSGTEVWIESPKKEDILDHMVKLWAAKLISLGIHQNFTEVQKLERATQSIFSVFALQGQLGIGSDKILIASAESLSITTELHCLAFAWIRPALMASNSAKWGSAAKLYLTPAWTTSPS